MTEMGIGDRWYFVLAAVELFGKIKSYECIISRNDKNYILKLFQITQIILFKSS